MIPVIIAKDPYVAKESRILAVLAISRPTLAQRETANWYFGQNASLEFNTAGTPVSFLNSAMVAPMGSASISDRQGNLLFYTDGETVWNRLHQVMQNGTAIGGNKLARQPAIIIPKPGSASRYDEGDSLAFRSKNGLMGPRTCRSRTRIAI